MMTPRRSFLRRSFGLILAGLVALTGAPALAQTDTKAASEFVQGLGDKAIAALADKSVGEAEREQVFRELLNENFDVQTIGRFVLGPYWRQATPEQQTEYMDLFRDMIVNVYAERFGQYSGETFKVTGAQPAGSRDAVVASQVIRQGPPVNVAWRVRGKDGNFQIVDVIVENVSMSQTQRSEFASVIEGSGGKIEALLDALRRRVQTAERR